MINQQTTKQTENMKKKLSFLKENTHM